jgi:hypothetical protein
MKNALKLDFGHFIEYIIYMTLKEYHTRKALEKKTFKDLVFNAHANVNNGVQAKLDLGNDLEISVVSMKNGGYGLYGDVTEGTYEVAVFQKDKMLPLSAFDDVIGWQSEEEVTLLMDKLQGKPEDVHNFIDHLYESKNVHLTELGLN